MLFILPAITANLKTFRSGISACCGVDYRATRCRLPPQCSPQCSRRWPRSRHARKPNPSASSRARDRETPAMPRNDAQPLCRERSPRPASPPARLGMPLRPARRPDPAAPGLLASCTAWDGERRPSSAAALPTAPASARAAGSCAWSSHGDGHPALLPRALQRLEPREAVRELPSTSLSQPGRLEKSPGRTNALAGAGSASATGWLMTKHLTPESRSPEKR